MLPLSVLVLTLTLLADPTHESANPLFQELCKTGLAISPKARTLMPAPTMPDGLDARKQLAVLTALAGQDYEVEELLRQSVVAPHILKFRDIEPADPNAPARGVDLWFIAHGKLQTFSRQEFDRRVREFGKDNKSVVGLKQDDLEKRKIKLPAAGLNEQGFAHAEAVLLDKVQLRGTSWVVISRTAESIVSASRLDPRFDNDKEFPNQWRLFPSDDPESKELGPPHPYHGAMAYLKLTQLHDPPSALFVEYHVVFVEPKGWFSGRNLLRSKLPAVIQSQVRSFRRELAKVKE